jgi:LPXTG-motif cell wall-anchored protein
LSSPDKKSNTFNVDSLTQILTTGVSVAGTIGRQRAVSGAAAQRQARIEACGRKGLGYLFSRRKKEEYRRCIEAANSAQYGGGSEKSYSPPPPTSQKSNTIIFIAIGAVLVIGGAAYFFMRKK